MNAEGRTQKAEHVPRYVVLCPGQGSQKPGMGKEFYEQSAQARAIYDQANSILGFSLSDLCFNGPEEKLMQTELTQLALYVTSVAIWESCKDQWPVPAFVAGHSLGEISALTVSGALAFAEGLRIVQKRGQLMAQAPAGAMAAILKYDDIQKVEGVCRDLAGQHVLQIANYNSPVQVVVTGHAELLRAESTAAAFKVAGARRFVLLPVGGAFHSPLMRSAAEAFESFLKPIPFAPFKIPVVSNVTAQPYADPQQVGTQLAKQLISAVRWTDSLHYMQSQGVNVFVELGSGAVLTGLVKQTLESVQASAVQTPSDLAAVQIGLPQSSAV